MSVGAKPSGSTPSDKPGPRNRKVKKDKGPAGWKDPATETVRRTFTIITTTPNEAMADLHDRMPVVIPDDAWDRWLDPTIPDPTELRAMLEPSDDIALRIYAVNRDVNDVRRDGPELIEPLIAPAPAVDSLGL